MISVPYRGVLAVLTLPLALYGLYFAIRVGAGFEVEYNEGWNAVMQTLAMAGQSPYAASGPLVFNNYPPLSFYVVGALGILVGDPVVAGRLVSLLSLLGIIACCGTLVRRAGGDRWDSVLSMSTCAGIFATSATDYVGMNDPQLLAQALLCTGLAVYAGKPRSPARMVGVAALFAAGLLCKHNVLILPAVVSLHVFRHASMRARLAYFGTGTGLAALAAGTILGLFGLDFFRHLTAGRTYDVTRGFLLSQDVLMSIQAPLVVAALYLYLAPPSPIKNKLGAYLLGSLVLGMLFSGGGGVDINVFFDTYIAVSILAGMAASWLRQQPGLPRGSPALLAILVNAGTLLLMPQTVGRIVIDALGEYRLHERLFAEDVAWLKRIPGPAVCESMLLCLRAGKTIWIDPYAVTQASATGRLPPDHLAGLLARGEVAVIEVSSTPERPAEVHPDTQAAPQRFVNFEDSVFTELERSFTLARVGITGRFYRLKGTPKPAP